MIYEDLKRAIYLLDLKDTTRQFCGTKTASGVR